MYYLILLITIYVTLALEVSKTLWKIGFYPDFADYLRWLSKKGLLKDSEYYTPEIVRHFKEMTNPVRRALNKLKEMRAKEKDSLKSFDDEIERLVKKRMSK